MPTPVDVNVPMTQVHGHVLRLDDPLLGDNPKVLAIRAAQAAKFFSQPEPVEEESPVESKSVPVQKTDSGDTALLISLFKMVIEWLCRKYTKEA